jgi:hypothetical protein
MSRVDLVLARKHERRVVQHVENVPLRPANLTNARYIGSQPNLEIRWAISKHFLAALNLAGFMTGTFLKQSPPSNSIVFANVGLTYRF